MRGWCWSSRARSCCIAGGPRDRWSEGGGARTGGPSEGGARRVNWLLVIAGALVGAPLRYLTDRAVQSRHDSVFPWGTFTVNVAGCLLLGLLAAVAPSNVRLLLGTGLCGALTTYSTFSYETLRLVEAGPASSRWRTWWGRCWPAWQRCTRARRWVTRSGADGRLPAPWGAGRRRGRGRVRGGGRRAQNTGSRADRGGLPAAAGGGERLARGRGRGARPRGGRVRGRVRQGGPRVGHRQRRVRPGSGPVREVTRWWRSVRGVGGWWWAR